MELILLIGEKEEVLNWIKRRERELGEKSHYIRAKTESGKTIAVIRDVKNDQLRQQLIVSREGNQKNSERDSSESMDSSYAMLS